MRKEANKDIKSAAKRAGVFHYEIAEKLGIQDSAFSRKLRQEIPQEEKERILGIIAQLGKAVTECPTS